jgi:periplasmic divalent cation tolerance protein
MSVTPPSADHLILVLSNAPDKLVAMRIAHHLVEERFAACVNVGAPVTSMYAWQGKLEGGEEVPMWIKSTVGRQQALIARLSELHPYEVPEIIVLPVTDGLPAYLQWVRHELAQPPLAEGE